MYDDTESIRREMVGKFNAPEFVVPEGAMTTDEVRERYDVIGFMAPFVVVVDRATGKKGTLEFTHSPRYYFGWVEDRP